MRRSTVLVLAAVLFAGPAVPPAASQDEDVPLASLPADAGIIEDADAQSFQVYRFPVSFPIRRIPEKTWGLRLYLPISFGTSKIETITDVETFFVDVRSVALVPGVEFLIPVGDTWILKPFGEIGVGDDSVSSGAQLLYSAGLRARGEYQPKPFGVMVGGALRYRNNTTTVAVKNWYSTVEFGADAQLPLGFSLGSRSAHGGVYAILRHYTDLEFEILTEGPIAIEWNYEAGLSFSTDPVLRLWKVKLPWIALGYRWGDRQSGLRLNFTFPF